jgi:Xaa-Pro aminopeptidase
MKTVKLSPLINSMRLVKSQEEIDLMKKSGEIASIAFKEVIEKMIKWDILSNFVVYGVF